ncbi:MAG: 50S ribosomal protein L11 methyltransferase, partial [Bacteroidales bacterium]|nr:50S ribosomal protein L11 methyltransferase [Bacteroidales bacterium]
KENVECNMVDITVRLGDASSLDRKYDVFIANINRNILLRDIKIYSNYTLDNGLLILSGFYTEDNDLIIKEANKYGFELIKAISKENWSALKLKKI